MTKTKGRKRWVGALLLAAGVTAVLTIRREPPAPPEPLPARPLKTLVVGERAAAPPDRFPGKVAAGDQVAMAFETGGTLAELPVREGERVARGQPLARLDPRDAQSQLDAAKAEMQRAEAQMERMKIAAEAKAVSLQELANAEASYRVAVSQRNIRQKALEDTELRARFDGIIARVLARNFESVQARQPILTLQDLSGVEIGASIPESRIAHLRPEAQARQELRFSAVFDFLPNRAFDLEFEEFSTEADALTQTFTARFRMPSPKDVTILPGMACMVQVASAAPAAVPAADGFEIPLDAVPVDGVGQYYVWLVRETEAGPLRVERRNVKVGPLADDRVRIVEGLARGDRIARAGVHVLREGMSVRLLETKEPSAP